MRTSFGGKKGSSSSEGSEAEEEEDGTMRDNVSWAEMAFGQSMRSTTSMMLAAAPKMTASATFKPSHSNQ